MPEIGDQRNPAGNKVRPSLDREWFAEQVRSSFRVFWGIALGIVGEPSSAEDVVQEATVVAMEKLDQFREGTSFTAWMGKMVRYVALNHARKERKRRPSQVDPESLERTKMQGRDLEEAGTSSFDARVVSALNEVGEVARTCLLLRTIERMGYSDIAELLGIPAGTAMSHVHRSRKFLRNRLAGMASEGRQELE